MPQFPTCTIARSLVAALAAVVVDASGGEAMATVPDALNVPANEQFSLEVHATGVQIYVCKAGKDDPKKFEWVFKAPEAELFDRAGKKVGRHFAGPTWESDDGSRVVGEVQAKDSGPDPDAIPWLLLAAKSTSGNGVFAKTKSIQRLDTVGGKAPAQGCGQSNVDSESRVAYQATYRFYVTAADEPGNAY